MSENEPTFDELWGEYQEMDKNISGVLGLDPIADEHDKEELRELWERGDLVFVGNVPVLTPT